jgi:dTMP kinase
MNFARNLIAIDGPNGVGKSTIIHLLKHQLPSHGFDVVFTKEPTNSSLGNFIRTNQDFYKAHTLAALVAADRYDHIDQLIKPNLKEDKVIITDRYVASSLVYQVQDGLSYEFVMALNSEIILPGLYFILQASSTTLETRLQARDELTRFETKTLSAPEGALFKSAGEFLLSKGASVHFIDNDSNLGEETAQMILTKIVQYLAT